MTFGSNTASGAAAGAQFGPQGAVVGAAVGLVSDILGAGSRRKAKRRARQRFQLQLGLNLRALGSQRYEQEQRIAYQTDRLRRASALGVDLFEASALASNIEGNSVAALSQTRLIEEGELQARAQTALDNIESSYNQSRNAAELNAHFQLTDALNRLEAQAGNLFDVAGNLVGVYGAFDSTGVFDQKTTGETAADDTLGSNK